MQSDEYKFSYSQGSILLDFVLGGFFVVLGIALKIIIQSWVFVFISAARVFIFWQAIKRAKKQGVQLKISHRGIWTEETGCLTWSRAKPLIKVEVGTKSVATYLIIVNRQNQYQELARFNIEHLDADSRTIQACLNKFSPTDK